MSGTAASRENPPAAHVAPAAHVPPAAREEPALRRQLGLTSAVMITVGSVIGSGIFLKPYDIARALPDPAWVFACWAGVGVVCLLGGLAYAELGAMFPEAGGQYAFLREAWGRFPAFLYGWCLLLVINTGTLAALAAALGKRLAPASGAGQIGVAAAMILGLAAVNHFGVRWGALVQNVSTFAKLAALGAIVAGGMLAAGRPAARVAAAAAPTPDPWAGLATAAVAIFWAYEGWHQLPFSAAELRSPRRDLPLGLLVGLAILLVTYVSVNAVYLHLVPLEEMRAAADPLDVPAAAVARALHPAAARWLVFLICLSIFGAGNPNLLSAPRAFYAMAKDGVVPSPLLKVHPRFATPTVAIWFQAVWALALVLYLRTFKDITEYVVFASLLFYAIAVAGVYVLRRRRPDAERPFRCWGYPLTPSVFILVVLFVDVRTLLQPAGRANALVGLGIMGAGVPVWFLVRHRPPAAPP